MMSGAIGLGEFGLYGVMLSGAVADSMTIKQQLDTLTEQAGTGYIATGYAGLGGGAAGALSLAPEIASLQSWQNNISAATGTMGVAQSALSQLSAIASNFYAQAVNVNDLQPSEVDSIAGDARSALQQVAGLLDAADAGDYVFGGQDTQNPPVPHPDAIISSGFYTQIQAAVAALATNGAAATTAATLAIASSNAPGTSPFSATLSQPAAALANFRPVVANGPGQQTPIGIVASANADVVSTGSVTTGSYTRDIMWALATLGSLSSSQASDAGFSTVVSSVFTSLGNAITALNQDAGVMGDRQAALQTQAAGFADTATALQTQIGNTEDVDMATTLSELTQTQTRLQASYQLISGLGALSLAKFLPAGA
jgi:flagellin-like hook-associated protein FlgL